MSTGGTREIEIGSFITRICIRFYLRHHQLFDKCDYPSQIKFQQDAPAKLFDCLLVSSGV